MRIPRFCYKWLCFALLYFIFGSYLVSCTAPAAPAVGGGDAAGVDAGGGADAITLRLLTSETLPGHISPIRTFSEQFKERLGELGEELGINIEIDEVPFSMFVPEFHSEREVWDIVVMHPDQFANLRPFINNGQELLYSLDAEALELLDAVNIQERISQGAINSFRAGGSSLAEGVLIGGDLYGIPWRRFQCTSIYASLGIGKNSEHPERVAQLVQALTSEDEQQLNFDSADSEDQIWWYPTNLSVNDATTKCPDTKYSVVALTSKELQAVQEQIRFEIEQNGGLLAIEELGDPLLFDELTLLGDDDGFIPGVTGLIERDPETGLPAEEPTTVNFINGQPTFVQAVIIPIRAKDPAQAPDLFSREGYRAMFEERGVEEMVIGALIVNELQNPEDIIFAPGVYPIFGGLDEGVQIDGIEFNSHVENLGNEDIESNPILEPFATIERGSVCARLTLDERRYCWDLVTWSDCHQ